MIQHDLSLSERQQDTFIWHVEKTKPFQELIVSWNGFRPKGKWTFEVSLFDNEWLPFAEWGSEGQKSFKSVGVRAETYQDIAFPKVSFCTSFKVKVTGDLRELHSLYASLGPVTPIPFQPTTPLFIENVPRTSQLLLNHPRHRDFCSPTSTSMAVNYLGKTHVDPVVFASRAHDQGFDIYGNWILNAAEAYCQLGGKYRCHVERLAGLGALYEALARGTPVVASVKGPIAGAPLPYNFGHLICVVGCNENEILCNDPGFPTDEQTFTKYKIADFLTAWERRKYLAYLFTLRS